MGCSGVWAQPQVGAFYFILIRSNGMPRLEDLYCIRCVSAWDGRAWFMPVLEVFTYAYCALASDYSDLILEKHSNVL